MAINDDDFPVDEATTPLATEAAESVAATESAETAESNEPQAAEVTEATEPTEDEAKAAAEKEAADKAAAKAEADKAYEAAMTEYQGLVTELVGSDEVDPTTGTLPDGHKSQARLSYSKLPGIKGKKAGKDWLQEQMHVNMEQFDPTDPTTAHYAVKARTFLDLYKEIGKGAVKSESPVVKPVDPTEAHVARVVAALVAPNLILPPEGVSEDWKDQAQRKAGELAPQIQAYRDWLEANKGKAEDERSEAPEVDEIVVNAAKVALGRGLGAAKKARAASAGGTTTSTPYTGTRRDIGKHIAEAFESQPVGTFLTVADISKFESSEYGTDHPSSGAVSARLFPKGDGTACTVEGIRGEGPDQGRDKKGGLKFA